MRKEIMSAITTYSSLSKVELRELRGKLDALPDATVERLYKRNGAIATFWIKELKK